MRDRWPCAVFMILLLSELMLVPGSGQAGEVPICAPGALLGGQRFSGTWRDVATDQGDRMEMVFESTEGVVRVPGNRLVVWGHAAGCENDSDVVVTSNDRFALEPGTLRWNAADDVVTGVNEDLGEMRIGRHEVRRISLGGPPRDRRCDVPWSWSDERQRPVHTDRVWLRNGDRVEGNVRAIGQEVVVDQGDRAYQVRRSAVDRIDFAPTDGGEPNAPSWIVGLADGSLLGCRRIDRQGDDVTVTCADGTSYRVAAQKVVYLRSVNWAVRYLSDAPPGRFRFTPYLSGHAEPGWNRNIEGGTLQSGDRMYITGVGLTSRMELEWELEPGDARFVATVAPDDSSRGAAWTDVRVRLDDRVVWSQEVTGDSQPQPITISVAGAKRLGVVVDFAGRGDVLDYVNLLRARIESRD